MIVSGGAKHFYPASEPVEKGSNEIDNAAGERAPGEAIPPRYRNGWGGIRLEQVQRDQQEARRQAVRSLIRYLGKLWRRR